jgi:hypothetical protein
VVLLGAASAGCDSDFHSATLGIRYRPPNGVRLVAESVEAGSPVARFNEGLDIRLVGVDPQSVANSHLEGMVGQVLTASGLPPTRQVVSARAGTLPVGEVMRAELRDGDTLTLLYYIPHGKRFLLVRMVASEHRFGELEARVEQSLASLKWAP